MKQLNTHHQFLYNQQWLELSDVTGRLYSCDFSLDHYSDELYLSHRIPFLEQLNKAVVKRRAEFLAGRFCALRCLAEFNNAFNGAIRSIPVGHNRSPIWPSGYIGSISHCDGQAIATVRKDADFLGIGVDIENVVEANTMQSIKNHIVDTQEATLITSNGDMSRYYFTLLFSAKESFFKAAYPTVKRYFDFSAVSMVEHNEKEQKARFIINQTLDNTHLKKGDFFLAHYSFISESRVITQVVLDNTKAKLIYGR